MEPIEINRPEANCGTPVTLDNKLLLYKVSANDSGEGLPYAPIDWPNPGDRWRWKVGRRVENGYFRDRYLYPPRHLPSRHLPKCDRKSRRFDSKLSVEQYVRSIFPGADVNAFLNSFNWRIPSKELSYNLCCKEGHVLSDKLYRGNVVCKAANTTCCSLVEAEDTHSKFMSCSICCSEHGFCRYCCCILCSKTVDSAYGGYSYIKCEARLDGGFICGHIAHVDCGLRAYLVGTVGGSNGLDAEYYCRRCDSRTNLVSHVTKLLETCKTIDSHDDIEKILTVGFHLLHNSKKENAQLLLHQIHLAIAKLNRGAKLEDVRSKANISLMNPEDSYDGGISKFRSITKEENPNTKSRSGGAPSVELDYRMHLSIVEAEFDQIMLNLRQSQQHEYKLAEGRLLAQKSIIQNLSEQLDKERSQLARDASCVDTEGFLDAVLERLEQIEREVIKFKEMKEVAKGFGRTSKQILKNHFGLEAN